MARDVSIDDLKAAYLSQWQAVCDIAAQYGNKHDFVGAATGYPALESLMLSPKEFKEAMDSLKRVSPTVSIPLKEIGPAIDRLYDCYMDYRNAIGSNVATGEVKETAR